MLPGDEDKIKSQIEEAEQTIERESAQFDIHEVDMEQLPPAELDGEKSLKEDAKVQEASKLVVDPSETVGPGTDREENHEIEEVSTTNTHKPLEQSLRVEEDPEQMEFEKAVEPPEASKDQHDDGGEVVEGEEDTVIY